MSSNSSDCALADPRFTVLTPTYNRATTLRRAFDSLMAQSLQSFEWLVVDDGSRDETRELIEAWAAEAPFTIRYVWQENGHKKKALNHGFGLARGQLIVILDSDDELTPNALEIFARAWDAIPQSEQHKYVGVRALCADTSGTIVGEPFPADVFDASPAELLYKYRISGEKLSCDRLDVLRRYPFPDVQGLVPEQVLWSQVSVDHTCRCVNEVVRVYHDSQDSLSRRVAGANYQGDVEGLAWAYTFLLDHDRRWFFARPIMLIKAAANRKRFLKHMARQSPMQFFPLKTAGGMALSLAFGWMGHILYFRDLYRSRGH